MTRKNNTGQPPSLWDKVIDIDKRLGRVEKAIIALLALSVSPKVGGPVPSDLAAVLINLI